MKNFRADGISVVATAKAVGEAVGNLYRWQKDPKVCSIRLKRQRESKWAVELLEAIRDICFEKITWGKLKIHAKLLDQGFEVSVSTVGRIISDFIEQGVFQSYDFLISGKKQRSTKKSPRHHATGLPKGRKANEAGDILQIDTVHVELADGRKVYHINAICPVGVSSKKIAILTAQLMHQVR